MCSKRPVEACYISVVNTVLGAEKELASPRTGIRLPRLDPDPYWIRTEETDFTFKATRANAKFDFLVEKEKKTSKSLLLPEKKALTSPVLTRPISQKTVVLVGTKVY